EDFAARWDRLLADLSIAPFASVAQATQILNVLSAPDSPLRALLVSAADETWLSRAPKVEKSSNPLDAVAGAATKAAEQAASKAAPKGTQSLAGQQLASVLGKTPAEEDIAGPFTDKRFKALHGLVGGNPPQIDGVMANLDELYKTMNQLGSSGDA